MNSNFNPNKIVFFMIIAWVQHASGSDDSGIEATTNILTVDRSNTSCRAVYGQDAPLPSKEDVEKALEDFNADPHLQKPGATLVLLGGRRIIRLGGVSSSQKASFPVRAALAKKEAQCSAKEELTVKEFFKEIIHSLCCSFDSNDIAEKK